ncbi:hypothetical protein [Microbacterium sp.]|uniref:hypothetical protein n=1 Tax=Microbacterium sp. TaxID=51671 RepID=UPI003C78AC43
MALSDALAKLAAQAKHLEASVESLKNKQHTRAQHRAEQLRTEIDQTNANLQAKLDGAADEVESEWNRLQDQFSADLDAMRAKVKAHSAKRDADRAANDAYWAEVEAEDAVDYAIYALQEAEYAILAAADAQDAADAASAGVPTD